MKSLKEKMINEGLIRKQSGLDLKTQIDRWMMHALFPHEESITKKYYSVNLDLTIQLNNGIILDCDDEVIPDFIQFANTEHDIQISMPNLKRLSGMPKNVECLTCLARTIIIRMGLSWKHLRGVLKNAMIFFV
jgi:hypothetical protein